MATKVSYPQSQAPVVPAGKAVITYPGSIPPSDPNDRIGEPAPDFIPNEMPPAGELDFSSSVQALRTKLTYVIQSERVSPDVAAAALIAAAASVAELGVPDPQMRERLDAALRELNP